MNIVRIIVKLTGIRCAGCLNSIDRILTSLDAYKFEYDFYTHMGSFFYKGEIEDENKYIKAIEKTGYGVIEVSSYVDDSED